jgi:hypothetical protein
MLPLPSSLLPQLDNESVGKLKSSLEVRRVVHPSDDPVPGISFGPGQKPSLFIRIFIDQRKRGEPGEK